MYFSSARTGMTIISHFDEHCQFYQSPFFLAENEVARVTNVTILIELTGIKMAAIRGDINPCTAILNPTMLYKMERIKLNVITVLPDFAYLMNLYSLLTSLLSMIASQAGVN
jgi:hypothetical protein